MTKPEELFHLYNSRYFRGALPKCKIVWADIDSFGEYVPLYHKAYKTEDEAKKAIRSGEFATNGKVTHLIKLARWSRKQRRQWAFTLIHEMVHVELRNEPGDYHGRKFQRRMKQLANRGAFNGLW